MARARLILLVTKNAMVTAGLMGPPLTWPIIQTTVATLSPKQRAICTNFPLSSHVTTEPHPTMVRRRVPNISAPTARQNRRERMSSKLVIILSLLRVRSHPVWAGPLPPLYLVTLLIRRSSKGNSTRQAISRNNAYWAALSLLCIVLRELYENIPHLCSRLHLDGHPYLGKYNLKISQPPDQW